MHPVAANPINPMAADPSIAQKRVLDMMNGFDSPLYMAWQPGAHGGKMEPSQRQVTYEELSLRLANQTQQFPVALRA